MKMVCNACNGPGFSYCASIPHSSASLLVGCGLKITQIKGSINLFSFSKRIASLKQGIHRQIEIPSNLSTTHLLYLNSILLDVQPKGNLHRKVYLLQIDTINI